MEASSDQVIQELLQRITQLVYENAVLTAALKAEPSQVDETPLK